MAKIEDKLKILPALPGCYLMKNKDGDIIYVGKAKKLKQRVRQYFVGAHDFKTTRLVSHIDDFEYIVTSSEKEALLLEINLIKKHTPPYNIMFMDDKSYPYLKLTKEAAPVLKVVRNTKDRKAYYFGPFPDSGAAWETAKLLNRIYPLRKCRRMQKKECLYYHMGQCLAPCIQEIDEHVYAEMVSGIQKFMRGDVKDMLDSLRKEMEQASAELAFEKAQEKLSLIQAIEHVTSKQQIDFKDRKDRDVFGYYVDKAISPFRAFFCAVASCWSVRCPLSRCMSRQRMRLYPLFFSIMRTIRCRRKFSYQRNTISHIWRKFWIRSCCSPCAEIS